MSVILFEKCEVYQELADGYEGLKSCLESSEESDIKFYKSLRRLYFANVATYLCQYHDEVGLTNKDLPFIDPFMSLQGKADPMKSTLAKAHDFLSSWGSLRYNLVTNDGEEYHPIEAYGYINEVALRISREVIEQAVNLEEKH